MPVPLSYTTDYIYIYPIVNRASVMKSRRLKYCNMAQDLTTAMNNLNTKCRSRTQVIVRLLFFPQFIKAVTLLKSHDKIYGKARPPLWSSGQSFWLQIQRSRVRFPALPDFLSSSGSGMGSTQPREVN